MASIATEICLSLHLLLLVYAVFPNFSFHELFIDAVSAFSIAPVNPNLADLLNDLR